MSEVSKYKDLFPEFVDILGVTWKISVKAYQDDPYFEKKSACGYCSGAERTICVCDESTWPNNENEPETLYANSMKHTLRHEIVHAFLYECGLDDSSLVYHNGWAKNEEMIDWMSLQGEKLYSAWKQSRCLEAGVPESVLKET